MVVELSGKKLLIVDDEPDITESLKIGLERRGMRVTAFNDPLEAVGEIKKHREYDLIITDIRMPAMTGFELYREIRKYEAATPVCFMTAFEIYQTEFEKMFPEIKPRAFLIKPLGIEDLASRIKDLFDEDAKECESRSTFQVASVPLPPRHD
jgi:DNA-binding response OmpR family regulator